ncbi:amidohydrolase [Shewanella eurypsychrophilus]|uniref:Amidohydrolase n=1 Tax=Shewanella eurypsychrophilus TaxID=2593656 RepID=A0ABX6VAA7_9GAMM|nr:MULTISPECIES: amidohydrolase [Shewanella]QFU24392.1 amidohydrolase family protein [Shewanella sp. YLB-09]QPG59592.1 amidohydrolase [Shewanella eurypsychrophilus]
MKITTRLWPQNLAILLSLSTPLSAAVTGESTQITVINNLNGYTVNQGELVTFTAIQFTGNKIDKLFTTQVPEQVAKKARVIDADGKTMLPGLIDAHGHVLGWGLNLMRTNLRGSQSEDEAVTRTVKFRKLNPKLNWVQGRGWNQVLWPEQTFPTAAALDKHFPDTPVWLRRVDGHAGWANSAAMKLAGIDRDTKSPKGGEIIRTKAGMPSGVFIDNAMSLISKAIPDLSVAEQETVLKAAMTDLARLGLTSVHDAGVSSNTIAAYKNLANKDEMPIRVYGMVAAGDPNFASIMARGPYHHDSGMLDFSSVKISSDGALGSRGAALIEDYSDLHGHKGLLLHSDKQLKSYMLTAMKAGFQVNTHAIGDHANKLVLDSYEALIKQTGTKALRHRVEHAQILRLVDIPRFAELGVVASMQATHATSDKNMAEDRVGSNRIKGAYAWHKLLKANAVIAAGSDFPVESANPFFGLHASVTRQDHHNQPAQGWYPDEKMTMTQALNSFTVAAAYSAHQENTIGQLAPGMNADFILIDHDLVKDNPQTIWQTRVLETWINGTKVFDIEP